jgi:hypothetical protein
LLKIKIFEDLSDGVINGRINTRFALEALQFLEISNERKSEFQEFINLFSIKLCALWSHYLRYKAETERLRADPPIVTLTDEASGEVIYSQTLFIEFDEFLVQLKSSLDYLSYVPAIFYGEGRWTLKTFGHKGEKFFNALERSLPKNDHQWVEDFKKTYLPKFQPYIDKAIDMRDSLNHFIPQSDRAPLSLKNYRVCLEIDRKKQTERFICPVVGIADDGSTVLLEQHMYYLFFVHIQFCETLLHLLITPFLKKGITVAKLHKTELNNKSPWEIISFKELDRRLKARGVPI